MRQYFVYMLAGRRGVLYVGVTNNLPRRLQEHRTRVFPGFAPKYRVSRLVYYECCSTAGVAIAREKQIKGRRRSKKIDLIKSSNPSWKDLCGDWFH
jgi:putative endonuclease